MSRVLNANLIISADIYFNAFQTFCLSGRTGHSAILTPWLLPSKCLYMRTIAHWHCWNFHFRSLIRSWFWIRIRIWIWCWIWCRCWRCSILWQNRQCTGNSFCRITIIRVVWRCTCNSDCSCLLCCNFSGRRLNSRNRCIRTLPCDLLCGCSFWIQCRCQLQLLAANLYSCCFRNTDTL